MAWIIIRHLYDFSQLGIDIIRSCTHYISYRFHFCVIKMTHYMNLRLFFIFYLCYSTLGWSLKHIPPSSKLCKRVFSLVIASSCLNMYPSMALDDLKRPNLSPMVMAKIVADDITERQALITADFTRSIYAETATFQDEIDTYKLEDYIKGTKALFDPSRSHVDLIGDVSATDDTLSFKFKEYLCFNIPFKPTVTLSGKVVLKRGEDGLIVKSREIWDQTVADVLRTIKF